MSNENANEQTLALGCELNQETWDNFVTRLRHDCVGEGVEDHRTADAIFIVERRERIYGIHPDYTGQLVVCCDGAEWFSPKEYWDDCEEEQQERLDEMADELKSRGFLDCSESDQWCLLGELDEHYVTGWDERWSYVCSHFTKDAAEAFIQRKRHDYPLGLRVYVDAQTYCWEYNTIKEAIMSGRIGLIKPEEAK